MPDRPLAYPHKQMLNVSLSSNTPRRDDRYYLAGGNVVFLVDGYLFRVHQHLFRDSSYFRSLFDARAPSEHKPTGLSDLNPYVLEGVGRAEFQCFLWMFYSPFREFADAPTEDWTVILALAAKWHFPEVKYLVVRELEHRDISPVVKIALYQRYGVDKLLLVPLYLALIKREEPLLPAEGKQLGVETALRIARARELSRGVVGAYAEFANARRKRVRVSAEVRASDDEMTETVHDILHVLPPNSPLLHAGNDTGVSYLDPELEASIAVNGATMTTNGMPYIPEPIPKPSGAALPPNKSHSANGSSLGPASVTQAPSRSATPSRLGGNDQDGATTDDEVMMPGSWSGGGGRAKTARRRAQEKEAARRLEEARALGQVRRRDASRTTFDGTNPQYDVSSQDVPLGHVLGRVRDVQHTLAAAKATIESVGDPVSASLAVTPIPPTSAPEAQTNTESPPTSMPQSRSQITLDQGLGSSPTVDPDLPQSPTGDEDDQERTRWARRKAAEEALKRRRQEEEKWKQLLERTASADRARSAASSTGGKVAPQVPLKPLSMRSPSTKLPRRASRVVGPREPSSPTRSAERESSTFSTVPSNPTSSRASQGTSVSSETAFNPPSRTSTIRTAILEASDGTASKAGDPDALAPGSARSSGLKGTRRESLSQVAAGASIATDVTLVNEARLIDSPIAQPLDDTPLLGTTPTPSNSLVGAGPSAAPAVALATLSRHDSLSNSAAPNAPAASSTGSVDLVKVDHPFGSAAQEHSLSWPPTPEDLAKDVQNVRGTIYVDARDSPEPEVDESPIQSPASRSDSFVLLKDKSDPQHDLHAVVEPPNATLETDADSATARITGSPAASLLTDVHAPSGGASNPRTSEKKSSVATSGIIVNARIPQTGSPRVEGLSTTVIEKGIHGPGPGSISAPARLLDEGSQRGPEGEKVDGPKKWTAELEADLASIHGPRKGDSHGEGANDDARSEKRPEVGLQRTLTRRSRTTSTRRRLLRLLSCHIFS